MILVAVVDSDRVPLPWDTRIRDSYPLVGELRTPFTHCPSIPWAIVGRDIPLQQVG